MSDAIKIRTIPQGEFTDIRILMPHPMETGMRKDDAGKTIPAHFIQTIVVSLNGKTLVEGQLNTSVARNPLFTFRAKGIQRGDKIGVRWIDNTGDLRHNEITVA